MAASQQMRPDAYCRKLRLFHLRASLPENGPAGRFRLRPISAYPKNLEKQIYQSVKFE